MPFTIVRNNITNMSVDAIVNTANPYPVIGDGTDRAIHKAAGPELLEARKKIGAVAPGQAVITPAYNLDAEFVIHTVGPVWIDGNHDEAKILEGCYRNSLKLALLNRCESVAFPLISSGTYGFPKDLALQIATNTISKFVMLNDIMVYLVVFDKGSYSLSEKLFNDIESYIDENYVDEQFDAEYRNDMLFNKGLKSKILYGSSADLYKQEKRPDKIPLPAEYTVCGSVPFEDTDWDEILKDRDETFSEALLRIIAAKGMTNPQVYNKANIDKKHFAKIKNNKDYRPTKYTVLAFAIALKLNMDETKALMEKAGLALTKSNKFDLIVSYFIEHKRYDVFELNDVLFEYDLPLLGC